MPRYGTAFASLELILHHGSLVLYSINTLAQMTFQLEIRAIFHYMPQATEIQNCELGDALRAIPPKNTCI